MKIQKKTDAMDHTMLKIIIEYYFEMSIYFLINFDCVLRFGAYCFDLCNSSINAFCIISTENVHSKKIFGR